MRWTAAAAAATVFAAAGGTAAFADDISNDLDMSVDAVAEVMPLTAGGPNGSTVLSLVERNGDGKNGCNLPGSTTFTVSVASSDPSVATVSPSSVTFTSCGFTQVLTVTPLKAGATDIALTETGNTTGGTFNLAPAAFTVNVAAPTPTNTPPAVGVTGVAMGGTYEFGAVPSAGCQVIDTEDGSPSAAPTLSTITGSLATYGLGSQTATCSYTDAGGLTAVSSATYSIVDTTAPSITIPDDIAAEATTADGAIVTYVAGATDLVDPDPQFACSPASGSTFALGDTEVTCTATDAAGNKAEASFHVTVQDTTAPGLTVPAGVTAEATGPGGAAVSFAVTAEDLVDPAPVVTCDPASGATFPLGDTEVTCTATDAAGNQAKASFHVTVQDTTAPDLTVPGDITAEATGPGGAAVSFTVTAEDLVDPAPSVTCDPASGSTFALGDTEVTCTATDAAGNKAEASFHVTVQDTIAPDLTWVGGPADGATYVFGSVPSAGTCTAVDLVDGQVPCTITGYSTSVGTHTVTASATDASGNSASEVRSYTVDPWSLSGFYKPVEMNGVFNTVKGGSTVPLKFEVFAGSTELTSTSVVQSFKQSKVACDGSAPTDEVEVTTTGGTSLRYDSTGGQFIQNWQTPKAPGTCYKVTMTTQDGSSLIALFQLK